MKQADKKEPRLKIFMKRFEELRKERNMSNTEFAKFLDMSRQTVGFYLNGDRTPDAVTLIKIAEKCNVPTDWLLGLSDNRTTDIELRKVCDYTGLNERSIRTLAGWKQEKDAIEKSGRENVSILDTLNNLIFANCDNRTFETDISLSFRLLLESLSVLGDIYLISNTEIEAAIKEDIAKTDGLLDYSEDKRVWRDIEEYKVIKALQIIMILISRFGIERPEKFEK